MRAFTGTPVTKDQLVNSLKRHAEKESFATGHYWEDFPATGCGIGCSIHDFAPGEESDHGQYENLFGIPAELAVLEDHIFEHMTSDHHRPLWPLEFAQAVPQGADLDQTVANWLLKLTGDGSSPIYDERHHPHIQAAQHLLHRWMETGTYHEPTAHQLKKASKEAAPTSDPHAVTVSELILDYVYNRTKDQPYTISDMSMIGTICNQAAISYEEQNGAAPTDDRFHSAMAEATHRLSRLLLQALEERS